MSRAYGSGGGECEAVLLPLVHSLYLQHCKSMQVRACLTGPAGTPYAGGLFFFDVLLPKDYPADAPLMLLETTGGGRIRFNPNLYADGKVCLSLLGTWHGSESEKWNPDSSTLWQILVSIQAMVLVEDPYFNEPNVEQMRGQADGEAASERRNSALRLDTIRWAMIDVLKHPRPGFEGAIRAHFSALRGSLLRQCQAWLKEDEAGGALQQQRLAAEIVELHALLVEL
jgi:ubiquitin-protein ligase